MGKITQSDVIESVADVLQFISYYHAGTSTARRMDKFTHMMSDQTGLIGMVGKAERWPLATESIAAHKSVDLITVGGAAYLVSKAITKSKVVAFPELGMEAIHELEVKDMPVTVAVDTREESVYNTAPAKWKSIITESIEVVQS